MSGREHLVIVKGSVFYEQLTFDSLNSSFNCSVERLFASSLFIAGLLHSTGAPQTTSVVSVGNQAPDAVATALMPVPIFNFAVHNVAFSPEGRTLATGDGHGVVRLWDTHSGGLQATVQAHTNWAFSVAWSADGEFFVTGGGDDLVHLFAVGNPAQPLKTFRGHSNDVHAVVMSPDGQHIVSAGDDRRIIVWNVSAALPEREWIAHEKQIPTLAVGPDGHMLASGSRDDSIRLWDLRAGELRETLIGHSDDVLSVRFSRDGKLLASASYDQTARLWDVARGRALRIFKGHTNRVFSVAFSPDESRLASAGDSTVRIWNTVTGVPLHVFSLGGTIATSNGTVTENLSAVAFSPDGKTLAVSSTTGSTFLLSAETGAVLKKFAVR